MNNNKIYVIGATIALILLFWGGCSLYKRGQKSVVVNQELKADNGKVSQLTEKVSKLTTAKDSIMNENSILKEHNKTLLKSLSAYQMHQSIIRSTNVAAIKRKADSLKNRLIDSIQEIDKNGLLIDYANYDNLSSSYDSCQQENKIMQSTIYSDSLFIQSYVKLIQAKDSLESVTAKQTTDIVADNKSKIRKRTLWIWLLGITNLVKDALVVDYFLKH